jgi:DNA-binding response OmpR family regulator
VSELPRGVTLAMGSKLGCDETVSSPVTKLHASEALTAWMRQELLNIVLVEDAAPDVFLVRQALQKNGLKFQLQVLEDGEKAVDFIEDLDQNETAPCPDLVLLDLNVPKKSGDQVLERIRSSRRCAQIPVVVVTSSDSPKDRSRAAMLGATQYFQKPSKLDEFMKLGSLVRSVMNQSS